MTEQQEKACRNDDPEKVWWHVCDDMPLGGGGDRRYTGIANSERLQEFARRLAPPSVEALNEKLQESAVANLELYGRIDILEATNAAQAERIGELVDKYSDAADKCAELSTLLQSSIPPEPQAVVELTDEEVFKAWHLKEYGDYESTAHSCRYRWQGFKAGRALNQRQAVKAEPKPDWVVGTTEKERFADWANSQTFNFKRHSDGGYYWSDLDSAWRAWQERGKPEPLSAAQGVPEEKHQARRIFAELHDVRLRSDGVDWTAEVPIPSMPDHEELFIGRTPDEALDAAMLSAAPEQAESKEGKNG